MECGRHDGIPSVGRLRACLLGTHALAISATSSPTPGPRRGKYTTATHGTPRMAAVPSRCPCPSHPAVTRPDPAEPVQLCSKLPPASRSKPLNQSRPGLSGGATGHATGRVLAAHRTPYT